mgnify:CR=1 FL=1
MANMFTDGSKLDGRVGGGVFCKEPPIKLKFRLPDHCSVFQAEVSAIKEAVDWLLNSVITVKEVNIYSDSQSAIRALGSLANSLSKLSYGRLGPWARCLCVRDWSGNVWLLSRLHPNTSSSGSFGFPGTAA